MDEAVAGIEAVARDPARHRAAAFEVARSHFSPQAVLVPMLEALFGTDRSEVLDS
jgi:hypothetical protein